MKSSINPRTIDGFIKSLLPTGYRIYTKGSLASHKVFATAEEAKAYRNHKFKFEMNALKQKYEIRGFYE